VAGEVGKGAFEVAEVGASFEHGMSVSFDGEGDGAGAQALFGEAGEDPRAEGAGPVIDFGLRQVEEIGTFDVAGADIITDGDADDLAAGVEDEGEFGFGHGPLGVGSQADGFVGGGDFVGLGFKEEFGSIGFVDAVVGGGVVGGFGDAGGAASEVGDAGGPDFLAIDGGEEFDLRQSVGAAGMFDEGFEGTQGIGLFQDLLER